jgi:hypothetical protein
MKDLAKRGPSAGTRTETLRYYYVPDGNGGVYREAGVIAVTNPDRIGPFYMTRTVTHSDWTLAPSDELADQ